MNILFLHQSFPGQFVHLCRHLADSGQHQVTFLTQKAWRPPLGIRLLHYRTPSLQPDNSPETSWANALVRGRAAAHRCHRLARQGYRPDLIVGHTGWGETLFLKSVFPHTPLLGYFEWFFGPAQPTPNRSPHKPALTRLLYDAPNLLALPTVDHGLTPTRWQWSQFPALFRPKISILHEGIDTSQLRPDPHAAIRLPNGLRLDRQDEVVVYHARGLEPTRGFPTFYRALPELLRRRPQCHVLILGGDQPLYGPPPPSGRTWRERLQAQVRLPDPSRVHFLRTLPQAHLHAVFRASSVLVYLTTPFVLSWSPLEAMSMGCLLVASDTPPVREVISHGHNGLLAPPDDPPRLARQIAHALHQRESLEPLRRAARATIVRRYDLHHVCLPRQLKLLQEMLRRSPPRT